ncbi:MAG TPA: hypothetical protein VGF85_03585 [Opitutaceae bacterium]
MSVFFLVGMASGPARADETPTVTAQLQTLIDTNRALQDQLTAQQKAIDDLKARLASLELGSGRAQASLPAAEPPASDSTSPSLPASDSGLGVRIGGEGGVAYFLTGRDGAFPNGAFRWDDAKLYLDASVWKDVYFYSELDLMTREASDQNVHFGEMYIDFENVSSLWQADRLVNVRVGRFYDPFGEEYQVRGVMENPLIAHSASDIWGMDQGIELYGQSGRVSYAAALMDGGVSRLNTAHDDKSIAGRIGFDPGGGVHLSASGMWTGWINAPNDVLSAIWFGNGFFRAISPAATRFEASLEELDASYRWKGGRASVAGGLVQFDDNVRGDSRNMSYYTFEATQYLFDRLYGAVRFSGIRAPGGYPIAGLGNFEDYFFSSILTSELYRLSIGVGYQFAAPVELKFDYSPEWGRTTAGGGRDREDLFSTELGVKF